MIEMLLGAGGVVFTTSSYNRRVDPGSGTLNPPPGAKAMRVAVIGAGGGAAARSAYTGERAMGGSGGGCAATKIVKAAPIIYSIGQGGLAVRYSNDSGTDPAGNGGDTTAIFLDYTLTGKGGRGGSVNANSDLTYPGGVGLGGDYSFQGGSASRAWNTGSVARASTGGGGAGPNGNGANGQIGNQHILETAVQGGFTNTGWGDGGGASGILSSGNRSRRAGGAGMGQFLGTLAALSTSVFGRSEGSMGGGGSINSLSSLGDHSNGGHGGLVVEWFY